MENTERSLDHSAESEAPSTPASSRDSIMALPTKRPWHTPGKIFPVVDLEDSSTDGSVYCEDDSLYFTEASDLLSFASTAGGKFEESSIRRKDNLDLVSSNNSSNALGSSIISIPSWADSGRNIPAEGKRFTSRTSAMNSSGNHKLGFSFEESSIELNSSLNESSLCSRDTSRITASFRSGANGSETSFSDEEDVASDGSLQPSSTVPPIIIFHGDPNPFVVKSDTGNERLGPTYESNSWRFFQAADVGEALLELNNPVTLGFYTNPSMVQHFQGSAYYALTLWDSQKNKDKVVGLIMDGNGGWHFKQAGWNFVARDGMKSWYYRRYYQHKAVAIKKVVAYLVSSENSVTASSGFVLIRYYWARADGQPVVPQVFAVKTERRPKIVFDALKKAAAEPERGRALGPTVIFSKVVDSTSAEDMLVNPCMLPKDQRQAKTAKQAAKKQLLGPDDLSCLMNQQHVKFTNIGTDSGTELVFFIGHPYQKNFFRAVGLPENRGTVVLDTSYNFGGRYVTSAVMEHPILMKKDGGPAMVLGPVFITPCISEEAYKLFAQYLRNCLRAEDVHGTTEWLLRFVTDGEIALYGSFLSEFPGSLHTFCSIHVWKNLKKRLVDLDVDKRVRRLVKLDIMGHTYIDSELYQAGLIDSESEEQFLSQYSRCKNIWESQSSKLKTFTEYFEREYLEKFRTKLILSARIRMGFGNDLVTTNQVEALHASYRRRIGATQDHRLVIKDIVQMGLDQLNNMALALRNDGDYRLRPQHQHLLIPPYRTNDRKLVAANQAALFFGDPGQTVLTYKNSDPAVTVALNQGIPQKSVSTPPRAPSFVPFSETGLDMAYSPVWTKAEEIYKNRAELLLHRDVGQSGAEPSIRCVAISADRSRKGTCYEVAVNGTTGETSCTCEFFVMSNLAVCKHAVALASAKGMLHLTVEWCKNVPRVASKALYRSKHKGKKPHQSTRKYHKKGATKRDGLHRVEMVLEHPIAATKSCAPYYIFADSAVSCSKEGSRVDVPQSGGMLKKSGIPSKFVSLNSSGVNITQKSRVDSAPRISGHLNEHVGLGTSLAANQPRGDAVLSSGTPLQLVRQPSLTPWRDSTHPFVVTKEVITNKNIKCPGCHIKMVIERPVLDLVLCRVESDFKEGTREVLKEKVRRYHMKTACVVRRQGPFDPKAPGAVKGDARWYTSATEPELHLVQQFFNGQV